MDHRIEALKQRITKLEQAFAQALDAIDAVRGIADNTSENKYTRSNIAEHAVEEARRVMGMKEDGK